MLEKPPTGEPCNGCGLCCIAQVCGTGSFTLGLVEHYGERALGPCPALVEQEGGALVCGMMLRPRDYAPGRGSAADLRRAAGVMIGAGAGCDEPDGDGPEEDAKLRAIQIRYLERIGPEAIERAAKTWFGLK